MSWFSAFLVLVAIVAFIGTGLGAMGLLIEGDAWWHYTLGTVLLLIHLAGWVWLIKELADETDDSSRREECEMAGGYWEQTGTRPIWVGKVLIMQPVYGCVMP